MKRWDFIIILFSIILSLMPIRLLVSGDNRVEFKRVSISVNGEEFENFKLEKDIKKQIKINKGLKENEITIEGGEIYMSHSNCSDKVCIRQGKIDRLGESVVCLPNRVFVEIKGDKEEECILSY